MERRSEFAAWLERQTGSAYVWGAQGHRVERDGSVHLRDREVSPNYISWTKLRETSRKNAERAAAYIRKKLDEGAESISCYDCSGLIMAYLKEMKGYLTCDMTSRALFLITEEIAKDELDIGDLVFRHNGERIVHVGAYVGNSFVIDSRGRDAGVVKQSISSFPWNRFGKLKLLDRSEETQEHVPYYGKCCGKSVYVRSGAGTAYPILATAHRGDKLIALPEENGWQRIAICCKGKMLTGYMSAKYIEYAY